ncbi:SAF domain-containing protein [Halomonas sp. BC04]|uniref:SAF domain-containing protein n=1 Tax=Halomonas sp. BC04 TaxID=1403540 RepID=UPI003FA537AD
MPHLRGRSYHPWPFSLKRPGSGLSPSLLNAVIGRRAARAIDVDELLDWEDLT